MIDPDTLYPMQHIPVAAKQTIFLKNFIDNPNIKVGDYTYYHSVFHPERFEKENVLFGYNVKLTIGKFCQIAEGVKFLLGDANHKMDGFSTYPFCMFGDDWKDFGLPEKQLKGDTCVGNDVWFGHHAAVMPGVTIGDGAIVGAYAVVTRDVEPYSVVGGNPALPLRRRFDAETVRKLLEIKWWEWDYSKICRNLAAISGADIARLQAAT